VTTTDAISVIVLIMRHMHFLFCYDQRLSQPDKDLTEEWADYSRSGVCLNAELLADLKC
jgi:hypothetical protein